MSGKLRVGVVGAGWWAVANHLPVLKSRSDVDLVAVCRLGRAELAKVQSVFGIPYGTEDFAAMLDEAPMDALVVASPHNLHGAHAIAALERGLHVLIEKPMTVSAAEARAIAALARAKHRHVLVPYGWNFKPYFRQGARPREQRTHRSHPARQRADGLAGRRPDDRIRSSPEPRRRCSSPTRKPGPTRRPADTAGGSSCTSWEACST